MALVFPGGPAGLFDVLKPTTHWNCAGDEVVPDIRLDEQLVIRLNATAVGEALFVAASHADKNIVWQWCVVNKKGVQHVYHATAAQASNGPGGARIAGVKSVAQWLGAVCRTPQRAPVSVEAEIPAPVPAVAAPVPAVAAPVPAVAVPPPTLLPFDILALDIWENTYTQRDSAGVALGPTREGVLIELDRVHYLADTLRPRSPKRNRE